MSDTFIINLTPRPMPKGPAFYAALGSISKILISDTDVTTVPEYSNRLGITSVAWPYIEPGCNLIPPNTLSHISSILNNALRAPVGAVINPADIDDISIYLAVSAQGHLSDGWKYLSSSATSFLTGSRRESIHAAYYAELRAAMGLLAEFGIGVNNNIQYSISSPDANGDRKLNICKGFGTHIFVWAALNEALSGNPRISNILSSLELFGKNLIDWLDLMTDGKSTYQTIVDCICNWGYDLSSTDRDRELRNISSYNIDTSPDAYNPISTSELETLIRISGACNADPMGNTEEIDSIVLKSMRDIVMSNFSLSSSDVEQNIRNRMEVNGEPEDKIVKQLEEFDYIINISNDLYSISNINNQNFFGIFCRALLLLKLSSQIRKYNIHEMNTYSGGKTSNWCIEFLEYFGENGFLWEQGRMPDNFIDVSEDYIDTYNDIKNLLKSTSVYDILKTNSSDILKLLRFERVLMWTVAV